MRRLDAITIRLGQVLLARVLRALANRVEPVPAVITGSTDESLRQRFPNAPDDWLKFVSRHQAEPGTHRQRPGHDVPTPVPSLPPPQPGMRPHATQQKASPSLNRGQERVFADEPETADVDPGRSEAAPRVGPVVSMRWGPRFDANIGDPDRAEGRESTYSERPPPAARRLARFGSAPRSPRVMQPGAANASSPSILPQAPPAPAGPGWRVPAPPAPPGPGWQVPAARPALFTPAAQVPPHRSGVTVPPIGAPAASMQESSAADRSISFTERGPERRPCLGPSPTDGGPREALGDAGDRNEHDAGPEWAKAGRHSPIAPNWSSSEPHPLLVRSDGGFAPDRWAELPHEREDEAAALRALELVSKRARVSALSAAQEVL